MSYNTEYQPLPVAKYVRWASYLLVAIIVLWFALSFVGNSYGRWNTLQNELNQVQVNDIQISQTRQLIEVERQKKQIRIVEAEGIAASQRIINGTLTPQYLQHEAIQAQQTAAENSSHTDTIYIPSGPQGIPLVAPVAPSTSSKVQ